MRKPKIDVIRDSTGNRGDTMGVKVVSFDLEGTLVHESFSESVWNEGIPWLHAEKYGLSFEKSKNRVLAEYNSVGDGRIEWYDIRFWFNRFGLKDHNQLFKKYEDRIKYYSEVFEVLEELKKRYSLVLVTNSSREFINILAQRVSHYFDEIFSATSDFQTLKRKCETYVRVCDYLNVDPSSVVHLGDRLDDDFSAPKEIGMNAFLLNRSKKASEDYMVYDLKDFSNRLKRLPE